MALTISIRFLTGRAHLHHWQAHHSDGKIDWPPSPWRLLRALVAVAGRGLTTLPYWDDTPSPKPEAILPIANVVSLSKRGRSKEDLSKLSFSKAKQTLTLKEPLTDEEADAFKRVNPSPEFASVLDQLRVVLATPVPIAMGDSQNDEIPLSRLAALLCELARTPEIWLPKTSGGHTRQFFPIHESGIVKNSGSAVFDTFAVVHKDQPILFYWSDIALEDQQLSDLKCILRHTTYFGRAESWCDAGVRTQSSEQIQGVERDKTHWPCICMDDGGKPMGQEHRDYTLARKLASLPVGADDEGSLSHEANRLLPRTQKSNPNRPKLNDDFMALLQREPARTLLLRCLLRESGQDMKDGLERPIGSRWVHYAVPRAIYDLPRPKIVRPKRREETVDVVRYALNTASVHRPVLPPLTDTLLVADKFRSAVLALHREPSARLSGHKEHIRDEHAFFWPTDEDNDGFIDHVTVYCREGFLQSEIDALRRLVRIRQRGGRPDLLVTPIYVGEKRNFSPWQPQDERGSDDTTRVFVSATPYFCPVHLTHGRKGYGRIRPITAEIVKGLMIHGEIRSEAEVKGIQEIVFDYAPHDLSKTIAAISDQRVEEPAPPRQFFPVVEAPSEYPPLPKDQILADRRFSGASLKDPNASLPFGLSIGLLTNDGTRFIRALSFCRQRRNHKLKGFGRMLRIEFAEPRARRPFAIGDQSHFGLGLFVPWNT